MWATFNLLNTLHSLGRELGVHAVVAPGARAGALLLF